MSIRTRFAPSPTGYLHIGGVRTALFNWLLRQRLGGQFILRIDDTDVERNQAEALQPILDGFRWLGIQWDEGPEVGGPYAPYFQSQRLATYKEAALKLLATGHAYPDYMTKEELDADKKKADAAKKPYVHRGPHRDTPADECVKLYEANPTTLRFKVPVGRKVVVEDLVRANCEQSTDLMGDPVILRANGIALYNFASVVDDAALKITHVVRASEHLANTYSQKLFLEALGLPIPKYAHIPVVNYKGEKMSKRKLPPLTEDERQKLRMLGWTDEEITTSGINIATVAFYKEMGYLPEAIINYLGRLGWSLDDKTEFLRLKDMISHFDMETGIGRVTKAPGEFDTKKLFWLQDEYMKLLSVEEKVTNCIPFLKRAKLISETPDEATLTLLSRIVTASGDRLKLFSDILQYGAPIFKAEPEYNAKSVEKRLKKPGAADLLREFAVVLAATESFDAATLDKAMHEFCAAKNVKLGDMVHPVRVATTGVEVGFGLFDTLEILGKQRVLERIEKALSL
ncbi:glutamate--tRNA ligase [Zavarzinella formosa]|uniref:glutamate--tRNA ligase n=1 Tax=Zavarzinella formosa TaxID=360055 RepID=UPI00049854BC|nr:glutamate--tRNA ligase [Zavarzinella formosa]